jgi:ferrochelatase
MIGVVVMAYGTPQRPEDVEAYYTHIRRGRPPEPEQLADLVRRYDAIGGISPMHARTAAQTDALRAGLDAAAPGTFVVTGGNKHAAPFIEDAVDELLDAGAELIVGLVLAPHYSAGSVGQYHARARARCEERGTEFRGVDSWQDLPAWRTFLANGLIETLAPLSGTTKVVFTAHSLPERILVGDPYVDELTASALGIAERAGLGRWAEWSIAWQSAGRTPEPWRGPDILAVIDDLAETGRADNIVVVPQGFTSDHLEVLYDLDIEAAQRAAERGLGFARVPVVNADAAVMEALAGRVAERARS